MNKILVPIFLTFLFNFSKAQSYKIEGYVYEAGNRGFIKNAEVSIIDTLTSQAFCETKSDESGKILCDIPPITSCLLKISKSGYKTYIKSLGKLNTDKNNFFKIEMTRAPGYLFEITLAHKKDSVNHVVDAISDYLVEVYNNTTEKEVMKLEHHMNPEFKLNMEKGNHYTILVRKEGYLAKQMEAYVNVKGCILCFDGISDVQPGVTDNLTSKNEYGVLLANVELERVFEGKAFEIKNILYNLGSAELKPESKKELDKVINLLKFNPNLSVELGAHTDARGDSKFNLDLSEKRAMNAVKYITDKALLSSFKISSKGYGETKLLNNCKDGVPCSEIDHAINRRTEIKINNISENWVFKPLVNIKNEEKYERLLLTGESDQIEQKIIPVEEKLLETPMSKEDAKDTKSTKQSDNSALMEVNETVPIETVTREDVREEEVAVKKEIIEEKSELLTEEDIAKAKARKNQQLSDGIKILVYSNKTPLSPGNEIETAFGKLETQKTIEGIYNYFITGFKNRSDAVKFMSKDFIAQYPKASIVEVRGGVKVN
ncbi:MAG: hypothetical protein RLZZ546_886 [Bacteroidota bacterium]|jgi:outer membrane protein OmpA-like peptidoglycan-associated protein